MQLGSEPCPVTGFSSAGACAVHAAAGTVSTANAGAAASAAEAGLVSAGRRHGERTAAAAGQSDFRTGLAGNHRASVSAAAAAVGRCEA